jgi:membrane-associated phospholipid phosphatase
MATGLSLACVYTRYHHALDVVAGVMVAVVAVFAARWLTRRA